MVDKIQSDLKQAQLDKDGVKVSTLRMLLSEIHNEEIKSGSSLPDETVVSAIQREAKKRKEAAEGFKSGGRADQAAKEEAELKILEAYLPDQMEVEELTKIVEAAINEVGAKNITDMGKVMSVVMGKVKGKADGSQVSVLVKEKLS